MTTWDANFEASPADGDEFKYGANEIRELKTAISERMELEHNFKANSQPFHKPGETSIVYVGNTAQIGALANMANGAIAYDTTLSGFKVYDGNAWTLRRDLGYANDIANNANDIANNANDIANNANNIAVAANGLVIVTHETANGVNGGGQTGGSWANRTINVERCDPSSLCSLSANQITLAEGTYDVDIEASFHSCANCQIGLYNVNDTDWQVDTGGNDMTSLSSFCQTGSYTSETKCRLVGRFTISSANNLLTVRSCTFVTNTISGWGVGSGFGTKNTFLIAKFQKVV